MKRFFSLVLALVLMCGSAVTAYAANMDVSVSSDSIHVGDTLTVTITLEENIDISEGATMMQGELHYDGDVLEFVSVDKSDQLSNAAKHSNQNMVLFHYLSMDNSAVGFAAGTLVTVTFQSKEDISADQVTTVLEFKNAYVQNAQGENVGDLTYKSSVSVQICKEHIWDDGVVTTEPSVDAEGVMTYTCTVCGMTRTEAIAKLEHSVTYTSVSVSLNGSIGLNYYVRLSDSVVSDSNPHMVFTFDGITQTVPLSQAKYVDGAYVFTCKLPAKRMADQVVGQMYVSAGPVGEAKAFSVRQYCDYMLDTISSNSTYAKLENILKAMLNYGAYSQIQLNHNTDNLANANLSAEDQILPEVPDLESYAHFEAGAEEGIAIQSVSLLLESETVIRYYFTLTGEKTIDAYSFIVDGVQVEPVRSGELYYVDKTNIAAKDIDRMYVVSVGGLDVSYCGLSYVRQVLNSYGSDESMVDLVNTVKALFAYNQAANAYFG